MSAAVNLSRRGIYGMIYLIGLILWPGTICEMSSHSSPNQLWAGDIKLYADDPDRKDKDDDMSERSPRSGGRGSSRTSSLDEEFGAIGRIGYWTSRIYGINDPMTHVDVMPYYVSEAHFFFSDLRGFVTNYGQFGGNVGGGYRYLDPAFDGWYGGSIWYDADASSSKLFQQIGLNVEAALPWCELRANSYVPVGGRTATLSDEVSNLQFAGHQLIYGQQRLTANSLTGFDFEAGIPIPVSFLRRDDRLALHAGWYYFLGKEEANIVGFKCRAEATLNQAVNVQAALSTDRQNGIQASVGMSLQLPFGNRHPSSKWDGGQPSPFRFVERNYNIMLEEVQSVGQNLVATDPETGSAYFFQHVSGSGTSDGDGSFERPFATLTQAQSGGGDVFFVRSDVVVTEAVTLNPGTRVLGDGAWHRIALQGYGTANLPVLGTSGDLPTIAVDGAAAITLASNTEVSGFQFQNITGDAIVGANLSDVTLSNLNFQGVTGNAIQLESLDGAALIQDLTFSSIGGNALLIDGGSPTVTLSNLSVNDSTGNAVVLKQLSETTVSIENLTIDGSQNSGLVFEELSGTVNVNAIDVAGTTIDGIRIRDSSADFTFAKATTIESDAGRGLVISGLSGTLEVVSLNVSGEGPGLAVAIDHATEDITFHTLTIDRTAGPGLFADSASSLIVSAGTIATVKGAAADIQNSATDITLTSIDVDDAVVGLKLMNHTGSFLVAGTGETDSGGTIQNTTTGVILDQVGSVELDWLKLVDLQTGVQSNGADYLALARMNASGITGYAVDSRNDAAVYIGASTFANNGSLGGGTIRIEDDEFSNYQVSISNNAISDGNGTAIEILNSTASAGSSLTLAIRSNTITGSRDGEELLQVRWNGPLGAEISGNTFYLNGADMVGVDIESLSTSSNMTATITENDMQLNGVQSTGFSVVSAATASTEYSSNSLEILGDNSTGFVFSSDGASTLFLTSNILDSTSSTGTTGFHVNHLSAGSTVSINANTLDFDDGTNVVDRGFVFTTVESYIGLQGTYDNLLYGIMQPLVIPPGQTTGGFFINGSLQQP